MNVNIEAVYKNIELRKNKQYFYCESCGKKNKNGNSCNIIHVKNDNNYGGYDIRLVCNDCLLEINRTDEIIYAGGSDLYDIKFSKVDNFIIKYEVDCAVPKEIYGDVDDFVYMWFIWEIDGVQYKTYFSPYFLDDNMFDVYVNGLTICKTINELPMSLVKEYKKLIIDYRNKYKAYNKYISKILTRKR